MLVDFTILRKLFPYVGFVGIGLSVTKLMIYYNNFDINILQYLELDETIILCFDDILRFFAYLFVIFILAIFILHKVGDINPLSNAVVDTNEGFCKRLKKFVLLYSPFILASVYLAYKKGLYIQLIICFALYILYELRYTLNKRYGIDLNVTYHNVTIWSIVYILISFEILQSEIKAVRDYCQYQGTTLQLSKEEQKIVSDSTIVYLGKTKNYFYLYDKNKQYAVIIPSSEVSRVDLKCKYKWFWSNPK